MCALRAHSYEFLCNLARALDGTRPARCDMRMRLGGLAAAFVVFPSTASAQARSTDSAAMVRRGELRAALAAAKARADSGSALVARAVAQPSHLELAVGDSADAQDLWSRVRVIGLTASADTVREFGRFFALQPNPALEQRGAELLARRPGTAVLWIYAGTAPPQRLFGDTTRVAKVEIRVR